MYVKQCVLELPMVGSFGILLFIILLSVDEGLDCEKCEDGIRATLNTQGKLNALVIVIHTNMRKWL